MCACGLVGVLPIHYFENCCSVAEVFAMGEDFYICWNNIKSRLVLKVFNIWKYLTGKGIS